jgi:hypothetical protein
VAPDTDTDTDTGTGTDTDTGTGTGTGTGTDTGTDTGTGTGTDTGTDTGTVMDAGIRPRPAAQPPRRASVYASDADTVTKPTKRALLAPVSRTIVA